MIRLIYLFAISCILLSVVTSCQKGKATSQYDIVKQGAEDFIKPKLNDPASYEFVELKLVDSTRYRDNIVYSRNDYKERIVMDRESIKRMERYREIMPSLYDKKEVVMLNRAISDDQKILLGIDSLERSLAKRADDVAAYRYSFSFRGKNALGAKVINQYVVQTEAGPKYTVINVTDDEDKVYLNPNTFPGYKDLIENNHSN